MTTKEDIPSYLDMMLPTLQAIDVLGGSAQAHQLADATVELLAPSDELVAISYPDRDISIYRDRIGWARSYCKLIGALESPKRSLHVLTPLGQELLAMSEERAAAKIRDLDRQVRAKRSRRPRPTPGAGTETPPSGGLAPNDSEEEPAEWRDGLLARLHEMSPRAFERFALYLLRSFDLELEHTGGSGDEGIDGIGVAPISPVLSAKVAVQVKRYKPDSSAGIGRQEVALFQRDAEVAGAERAIMVTLGRYTSAARKAAAATTPMVDLIDGEKLCELIREKEVGIRIVPQVVPEFFDRFESAS